VGFSTGVRLSKEQTPAFPPRCVGCDAPEPGFGVTVWTWSVSWWALLTALAFFWAKTAKVRAPFCRPCAWRLRLRRLAAAAFFAAAVVLAVYVYSRTFVTLPRLLRKLIAGGVVFVALIPFGLWHVLRPPSLNLIVEGDQVIYEFGRRTYAFDFAVQNDGRVLE
jgi:hypothetical protein